MKILVVRYRFIGDTILSIPFLRNLRLAYPSAQIDMLVAPNSGEVIENCPYVDNFIYFDTTRKHKYENGNEKKKSIFKYVLELRKSKYDKAYILKRSLSSALLCFFAGIKERIGFDTEGRGFLLTKKVPYDKHKHESLCFLDVLEKDGIKIKDTYIENWLKKENKDRVETLLKENNVSEKYAVVSVTASNDNKMWGINNFAEIIEYITNKKRLRVVFIGAKSDEEIYKSIKFSEELKLSPVNLCGQVNLQDSLAIIKRAEFVLGNDSGILHMASSVGTKVIGLYGPMPFEKWKALGSENILLKGEADCMPCSIRGKCPNNKICMSSIKIDDVKHAVDKISI